jgi:hypothetical protein
MRRTILLTALAGWAALGPLPAITITDLYGDRDGLGIGVGPDEAFNFTKVARELDDAPLVDVWLAGTRQWSHTYAISGLGPITRASFNVVTGGQGWYGVSRVYVDGVAVGSLTDGDGYDGSLPERANFLRLDSFDLTFLASRLSGATTVTIETGVRGDWWALDYSELILSDDPLPSEAETRSVPDGGATLLMLGLGLAGMWRLRSL